MLLTQWQLLVLWILEPLPEFPQVVPSVHGVGEGGRVDGHAQLGGQALQAGGGARRGLMERIFI